MNFSHEYNSEHNSWGKEQNKTYELIKINENITKFMSINKNLIKYRKMISINIKEYKKGMLKKKAYILVNSVHSLYLLNFCFKKKKQSFRICCSY